MPRLRLGTGCWCFESRVVNPWVLPLQKSHSAVMVPGTASHLIRVFVADSGEKARKKATTSSGRMVL